jgi:hypothetical protein
VSFAFSKTDYRCVNHETRGLFNYAKIKFGSIVDTHYFMFILECNIMRFNYGSLQNIISQHESYESLLALLEKLDSYEANRIDSVRFMLRPYARTWDAITTKFFTNDYSRDCLVKLANILSSFSEHIIMRGIGECDAGKPLSYLTKILERMRAETLPALRREELYANRVNMSMPLALPQFRNPGFVSDSIAEELFFRAIQ